MPKDVILTQEGLANLKAELDHLSTTGRRDVAARIKEAREFGDISENAEYDDAKNAQAMLEARIAGSRTSCVPRRSSTPPSSAPTSCASARSSTSRTRAASEQVHDRRLGRGQARRTKLSNESPVGRALLGRKRNEEVQISTPRGQRQLKITKIDVS